MSPMTSDVRWTPEQRDEVWSWRGAVNPKFEAKALAEMTDPKARWAERVREIGYDFTRTNKWFQPGLGRVDPAVRPLMEAVLDAARVKKLPATPLDIDVEAGLVGLEIIAIFYSFRLWVAKEGLPFALRALARSHEYWSSGHEHLYTSAGVWLMHDRTRSDAYPEYAESAWSELRAVLAKADDATYDAMRKLAAELRKAVPPIVRAFIACAFTTETGWANEAADEMLALKDPPGWARALVTVTDLHRAERLARVKTWRLGEDALLTLLARDGSAAAPVILAALETANTNPARKTFANLLAMIETAEVAEAFTKWGANKAVGPIAAKYHKRLPNLAPRKAVIPANRATTVSEARSLPPLLTSPPWLAERVASAPTEPITLTPNAVPIRSAKRDGDLDDLSAFAKWGDEVAMYDQKEHPNRSLESWKRESSDDRKHDRAIDLSTMLVGPEDFVLAEWNSLSDRRRLYYPNAYYGRAMLVALERRGAAFIPGLLRLLELRPAGANRMPVDEIAKVLMTFDGTDIAELLVERYDSGKKFKAFADAWALRYPDTTASAAIVHAVGGGKHADAAIALLRTLVTRGGADAVRACAAAYERASKKPVTHALDVLVGTDPLAFFPAKMPKLPDLFEPAALTPIMLKSGGALPPDAVTHVATMLSISTPEAPYAGIAVVRAVCTADSLRDFAWSLFERWLAMGSPPKEIWILHGLGFFGDDETARRLTPMLRAWPGEGLAARAAIGIGVLASIGSDLALMMLDGIAEKVRFASIQQAARKHIEQIAEARGLSRDELADRLVPNLGFDARGERMLEDVGRTFIVRLDEQLVPHVYEGDKALRDLPKGAKAAATAFKALKKDIASVARSRIDRLEAAMIARRRWTPNDFRTFFVEMPLVLQLTKRLVWGRYDEGGRCVGTFRVNADGTLSNEADAQIQLAASDLAGVIHPIYLEAEAITKWSTVFGEYEILQPFAQLARVVSRPTAAEKKATSLASQHGLSMPAPKLVFGLEKRRWQRWGASDGGSFSGHSKAFAGTPYTAHVSYSGSVGMGYIDANETLVVESVTFTSGKTDEPLSIGEVDAVIVSEVLSDLQSLVS